jgi:uncharacterized protein YbjT (DUF2867 family)
VGCAIAEHPEHRGQNAAHGCHLTAFLVSVRGDPEEVPEEFVSPVDEVYLDATTVSARGCSHEHLPGLMSVVLVTGGSGTLGRPVVSVLRERGHEVRTLSRTPGRGTHTGDLNSGKGVLAAAAGADLVVHAASDTRHFGRADPVQTRHLLDACTGASHLLYISIVGIEDIPLGYYKRKLACEQLLGVHRVPYTTLRATQSHELIAVLLKAVQRLPIAPLPLDFLFQSVAAREVARRIADLIVGQPVGRAGDFGGPEVLTLGDMAQRWSEYRGGPRRMIRVPIPGPVGRGFRLGRATAPDHRDGVQRWDEFMSEQTRTPTGSSG